MSISIDYVVRETATNLRRNLLMTTAAILTVAVSLSLVGGALMLRQGVSKQTQQWRGGVELSIYLVKDVTPTQADAIGRELQSMPEVRKVTYLDHEAAYAEFQEMFADQPEFLETVTAQDLPPSFRVVPRQAELIDSIGERFRQRNGVQEVIYAKDTVERLLTITQALQVGILVISGVLLLAAALLILNTIRMAIFSRRREVAVMKLVGATNWFIRVPFMLEGLVQGLVGAAAAFSVVYLGRNLLQRATEAVPLMNEFRITTAEVLGTGMFILVTGALVGAIGSAIAVSRFLDV